MKVVKFTFSLFGINTYVVYDAATLDCAIIDPGMMGVEEEQALTRFIQSRGLKVTHVINTHLHIDHAIGDKFAATHYGVPVLAHRADEPLGRQMTGQAQMFGLSRKAEAVDVTQYLEEGDVVKIGDGELHVLHVPGHSPGSVVLYDKKDGFIIAGDVLFQGSVGRADLPGGDMPTLISGIKKKLLTLPAQTVVYPGHGPATTIGAERSSNPYLR